MASKRPAQSRPGDLTGQTKVAQQKQHAAAIQEASKGMSLINAPVVERPDVIVDYSGGGSPNVGTGEDGVRLVSAEEAYDEQTQVSAMDETLSPEDVDSLPDGTYDVRPEQVRELDEPPSAHQPKAAPREVVRTAAAPTQPVVEAAFKVLRVNTDLEDITIGKDNHYTFREGTRYKVPAAVYDHLQEKGYVYH